MVNQIIHVPELSSLGVIEGHTQTNSEVNWQKMTRRTFLRASAVLVGGTGLGLTSGCAGSTGLTKLAAELLKGTLIAVVAHTVTQFTDPTIQGMYNQMIAGGFNDHAHDAVYDGYNKRAFFMGNSDHINGCIGVASRYQQVMFEAPVIIAFWAALQEWMKRGISTPPAQGLIPEQVVRAGGSQIGQPFPDIYMYQTAVGTTSVNYGYDGQQWFYDVLARDHYGNQFINSRYV